MQRMTLSHALESLSLSDRATMAAVHVCDELQLATMLHTPRTWLQVLRQIDPATRALLDRIRRAGGQLPMVLCEAVGGPLRTNMTTLSPRTLLTIYAQPAPIEKLLMAGFVWPYAHEGGNWVVLPEVEALLPPPLAIMSAPDSIVVEADEKLPHEEILLHLACMAFDGRVPLQHHGKVSQKVTKHIAIDGVTDAYVHWLVATLLAGGAFNAQSNLVVPTELLLEWLQLPQHVRQQELARAWLQAAWSEWELGLKRRPPALDVRLVRRTMLQAVLPHIPDQWCAGDDIIAQLRLSWPDVMRPTPADGRWKVPVGWPTHWDEEDGLLIKYMLIGPMSWLGLVELAENGHYLRRTLLGGWHAGLTTAPTVEPPKAAVLEPDFCVVVPDKNNIYARFQLHRIADWNDAATAQLSPARVKNAIARGMSVLEYIVTLATITAQPVPVDIQTLVRRWGAEVEQIILSNVVILHANDAATISDIQHDRRIHLPPHEVIGGTRIALLPSDAIGVARRLRHAGYRIDTHQLRPGQFDEAELAIIDAALEQMTTQREAAGAIRRRINQMRAPSGDGNG